MPTEAKHLKPDNAASPRDTPNCACSAWTVALWMTACTPLGCNAAQKPGTDGEQTGSRTTGNPEATLTGGSGSGSTTVGDSRPGTTGAVAPDTGDEPSTGSGKSQTMDSWCEEVSEFGPRIPRRHVTSPAPALTGGPIVPGEYRLTDVVSYDSAQAQVLDRPEQVQWQNTYRFDGAWVFSAQRYSTATELTFDGQWCGEFNVDGNVLEFVDAAASVYTAQGDTLVLANCEGCMQVFFRRQ